MSNSQRSQGGSPGFVTKAKLIRKRCRKRRGRGVGRERDLPSAIHSARALPNPPALAMPVEFMPAATK
jgi:hypothetical protein